MKTLLELFQRCNNITYNHVEEHDGDFASEVEDGVLYIYFQKTNSKEDWKHNFAFAATPYKEMGHKWRCHSGFLKVWKSLKLYVKQITDCYLGNDYQPELVSHVVVCGYSHGAALAGLCHEWIWFHYPEWRDKLVGYGFGCPRFYWGWFGYMSKELKERWKSFYPVRCSKDLVTHLPPAIFGYKHTNKLLKLEFVKHKSIESHYYSSYCEGLEILHRISHCEPPVNKMDL